METGAIKVIAQELDEEGNVTREWDDTPNDFGRIAAETAKQVIFQRIREAEREMQYEEYAGREGDIVTGIIQQTDARYTLLDLGQVEALLPQAEQVQNELYDHGSRLKAYIVEVRKTAKGPQIVVSRTHPGLVKRLFELEVPEIVDDVVELKAIAREPDTARSSRSRRTTPTSTPSARRRRAGSRVRMVVNELRGEKVDIVPYSDDPSEFVTKALAAVREVRIHPDSGTAEVIVPDFQLSLAIGKEGQNARLAARLTGWRVDIRVRPSSPTRSRRRRRVRRRRVGHQRERRARVAAGRRRRDDLGRRGGLRGTRGGCGRRRRRSRRRGIGAGSAGHRGSSGAGGSGARRRNARNRRWWRRATDSPQRTCIGCWRRASVSELVRLSRTQPPENWWWEPVRGEGRGCAPSTRSSASIRRSSAIRSPGRCGQR